MDVQNIVLAIVSFLNLFLGFFLLIEKKNSRISISYAIFVFFIFLWGAFVFLFRWLGDSVISLLAMRGAYIGAALIPLPFIYFAQVFPEGKKIGFWRAFLPILPGLVMLFLLAQENFLLREVVVNQYGKGTTTTPLHYWIFAVYFVPSFFVPCGLLFKKYLISHGTARVQLLYVLIGVTISGILGTFFNLYLTSPYIVNYKLFWLGPTLTILMLTAIAYAILRYRLMDIKVVIRRSTVFTLLVLMLTAIYSSLIIFFSRAFGPILGEHSQLFTSLIVATLIVAGFQPLKLFIQKTTRRFLFKEEYDPQEVLGELSHALAGSIELQHLFDSVGGMVDRIFHPVRSGISLLDKKAEVYRSLDADGFAPEQVQQLNFAVNSPLVLTLQRSKRLIVLEEVKRQLEAGSRPSVEGIDQAVITQMEQTGGQVFVPLVSKDTLLGIFVLGEKKSGDIYSNEDLNLLEIGAAQAAVAIENALVYEEVKRFNLTLKEEVDKATVDLRAANERLKKLDEAKSEFISIASHQLRTPLTVIKGYISMMLEGSFGQLTPPEVESLHKVYDSNQRLINLVEDLLNISRIESGRLRFEWTYEPLEHLAESVVEELTPNAKKKKLKLEFLAEKGLPRVKMDNEKLRQVLMNLVDNAVKYTKKGWVHVRVAQDGGSVVVRVSDTGMGIDPQDMPNLFQKFSRGTGTSLVHTEGTGLGLYVAREIVAAHGGKVWAESQGPGQGSTFIVSLPGMSEKQIAAAQAAGEPTEEMVPAKPGTSGTAPAPAASTPVPSVPTTTPTPPAPPKAPLTPPAKRSPRPKW